MKLSEDGKSLFYVMNCFDDEDGDIPLEVDGVVVCYSTDTRDKTWEYHIEHTVKAVYPVAEETVMVQAYDGLAKLDSSSGKEIKRTDTGGSISRIYMTEDDKYQVLLYDGTVLVEMDDFSFLNSTDTCAVIGNWFEYFERMEDKYLTLEYNANRILVYDFKVSAGAVKSNLTEEEIIEKYDRKEVLETTFEVISKEKKQCAVVDVEQNAISFRSEDGTQNQGTYPCSARFMERLIYSPKGDVLCVVYSNACIDLIDTDSFECVNSMDDIKEVYACEEIGSDHFAFIYLDEAYVFEKETKSCIARIPGYLAYDKAENVFYLSGKDGVYTIPFYTNEELVNMAKESLE